MWNYSSNSDRRFWDDYWDAYFLGEVTQAVAQIGCSALEEGCGNPSLDFPLFDGCDLAGCGEASGGDGCNALDGCDGGGCDGGGCRDGCGFSMNLGILSNFCQRIQS